MKNGIKQILNTHINSFKSEAKKNNLLLKNGTTKMFKELTKKTTYKKQIANLLTFIRILVPMITLILSIFAINFNIIPLLISCSIIAGIGGLTDMFDGMISRKTNSTSEYGRLLDQISDKEFAGVIGLNLLFLNFNYLSILLGEAIIVLVNIFYKVKYKDLSNNSTLIGKAKMIPLFSTLILGYLSPINSVLMSVSNITIIVTLAMQFLTTISYIEKYNTQIKELKKNDNQNSLLIEEKEESYEKSLELKKNLNPTNKQVNNNNCPTIEQYQRLKDILEEIINKNNNNSLEKNEYQKTLKK